MSTSAAPPLPPRKTGPSPPKPPPLPPRLSQSPSDMPIPVDEPVSAPPPFGGSAKEASTPTLDVTPATPSQPSSPVEGPPQTFANGAEAVQSSSTSSENQPTTDDSPAPLPGTDSAPAKGQTPPADIPKAATTSALPPRPSHTRSRSNDHRQEAASTGSVSSAATNTLSALPVTPVEAVIIAALLVNLLVGRLSILWTIVLGGAYMFLNFRGVTTPVRRPEPQVEVRPGEGREAVQWVNHALYALFPLISTDVLTPFIDLLEDALIQQVPPVVTSVRLTSASLGAQPVLLTSMRPLTDQEWFASLASGKKPGSSSSSSRGKRDEDRTGTPTKSQQHGRTLSGVSRLSRSVSASSVSSTLGPDEIAHEATKRRKRDRILNRAIRHGEGHGGLRARMHGSREGGSFAERTGDDPEYEAQQADGERHRGGPDGMEMDADDASVGQYVNYQVGFEYARSEPSKKKGWGLHVLAYFGWGVKGIGGGEIPVYIDVLSIKGTLNLRLLLSATPPFMRTASFSFVTLPEFDISAKPLRQGSFNAMELPGMKTFVQKSIAEVAKAFVRPECYSLDLDRLLLGREASLRTRTVGLLHIRIHGAHDLPKVDTMGSCDPYVMICLTKFRKPVFSTRTIIDTQNPSWEEEAFVLISADAIESGERLRLRLLDSDRFSADDSMGVVEVDIPDLVEQAEGYSAEHPPVRRLDILTAERPGMKVAGRLEWSVRFCPLWSMPQDELEKRIADNIAARQGEPTAEDMRLPSWLRWINNYMDVPQWEDERAKRRQETVAWFTGDREREEAEAAAPPSDELRSGVLQFHIHQCVDLEVDSLDGTYSSALNPRLSAAAGKPALSEEIDRTPAEHPDPPSPYCEVHLNDRLVYRTRTKQVTPLPYFNAVSERFIRDWRMAKIVFVVRDERDREHDPILGLVTLYLEDALKDESHFTRQVHQWFPLSTGLGWGRIRISLLFKPIDIHLPPRLSGYEIATLHVASLAATDLSSTTGRNLSVMLETECDRYILESAGDDDPNRSSTSIEPFSPTKSLRDGQPGTPGSLATSSLDGAQIEWDITKPIKLAVQYRHSSSVVISFFSRSKVVKKKKVVGLAVCRLGETADGDSASFTVPVFGTAEVEQAMKGTAAWYRNGEGAPSTGASASPSRRRSFGHEARIIGYVTLSIAVHPGISRAHKRLGKKDLRFAKVYEAWESYRDVVTRRTETRREKNVWSEEQGRLDEDEDEGESESSDDEDGDESGLSREDSLRRTTSEKTMAGEVDKPEGFFAERRAHSKALHKKHKGIFQLKIVRTGQFVKDKIEAKVRSNNGRDRRRGEDLDVEHEGLSAI